METIEIVCNSCENVVTEDVRENEGNHYCEDCFNSEFTECYDCNEHYKNDSMTTVNGDSICESCMENYSYCEDCEEYCSSDDIRTAHDRRGDNICICDSCYSNNYSTCNSCDSVEHDNNVTIVNGYSYCNDCYSDRFSSCDNCGESASRDDLTYHEATEEDLCDSCLSGKVPNTINDYSYKPIPQFFGKGKVFLGIELEVDNGNDKEETAESIEKDFWYFKKDGSLNDGFEIVTHPCTFEYIKEQKPGIEESFKKLVNNSFRSHDTTTCGMHVHISKDSFNTWHLYRFLKFFKENENFIVKISQRKRENLNRWADMSDTEFTEENIISKAKQKTTDGSRYLAVNLNNRKTVEIRIFRGTLKVETFYKNIEFVQSLYEFTLSTPTDKINLVNFKTFVFSDSKFKNLTNFIKTKNL